MRQSDIPRSNSPNTHANQTKTRDNTTLHHSCAAPAHATRFGRITCWSYMFVDCFLLCAHRARGLRACSAHARCSQHARRAPPPEWRYFKHLFSIIYLNGGAACARAWLNTLNTRVVSLAGSHRLAPVLCVMQYPGLVWRRARRQPVAAGWLLAGCCCSTLGTTLRALACQASYTQHIIPPPHHTPLTGYYYAVRGAFCNTLYPTQSFKNIISKT